MYWVKGPSITSIMGRVEEALAMANDSPYGLSGGVVGPQALAEAFVLRMQTGNVYINEGPRSPLPSLRLATSI